MGWLINQVIASLVGAVIVVKIWELIVGGIIGPTAHAVKTSIFVSVWTAFTTVTGLRAFTELVRRLRHNNKKVVEVGEGINLLPKVKQTK